MGDIKMPDVVEAVTGSIASFVSAPLLIVAFVVSTIIFFTVASYFLIFDIFGFVALLLILFLVFILIIRVAKVRLAVVLVLVGAIVALMIISFVSDNYFGLHLYTVEFYYFPFEQINKILVV